MTETTLRQKIDGIIQDRVNQVLVPLDSREQVQITLTLYELQSLAEMLREDEPPDTTGVMPGLYSVTFLAHGASPLRSVTGEGIHNRHDVPVFERESDAESMCRCLSLAYRAGQRQRSRALMRLLDQDP